MPTDIVLDEDDGNVVRITANRVDIDGSDLNLSAPSRKTGEGSELRRALVHDENDGLTINFNGDYPGGVTIVGLKNPGSHTMPKIPVVNSLEKLSATGKIGELVLVQRTVKQGTTYVPGTFTSLFVCIGSTTYARGTVAQWQEIALGKTVDGTK